VAVGIARAQGGDGEKLEGGRWGQLFIGERVRAGSWQHPESSLEPNQGLVLEFVADRTKFDFWFIVFLWPQVPSDRVRASGACMKWTRCPVGSRCTRSWGEANAASPAQAGGHVG
jgi:hypothetical protein